MKSPYVDTADGNHTEGVARTPQELETTLTAHREAMMKQWADRRAAAERAAPLSDAQAALQALRRRKQEELSAENLRVRTSGNG